MAAAERLATQGRTEAALSAYQEVAEKFGEPPPVLYAIARLEAELGRWEAAGAALEKALPELPDNLRAAAHKLRGEIFFQLKEYDRAAQAWAAAAESQPDDFELWNRLGQFYLGLGPPRSAEAIAALEHAVQLDSERPLLRLDLGLAYERAGKLAQARQQYLRATQLLPDQPQAWTRLAALEASANQNQDAERHLRLALRADPSFGPALFELGNLLSRQGQLNEARRLLERYRQLQQEQAPHAPEEPLRPEM